MPVHHLTLLRQITAEAWALRGGAFAIVYAMRLSPVQNLSKANLPKTRFVFLLDCFTREDKSIGAENLCTEGRLSAVFVRLTLLRQITGRSVGFEVECPPCGDCLRNVYP